MTTVERDGSKPIRQKQVGRRQGGQGDPGTAPAVPVRGVIEGAAATAAVVALIVTGLTVAEARASDDASTLSGDVLAVFVASGLGLAVVAGVALWGLRSGLRRARRTGTGLATAAVVLLPLSWWNPIPTTLAVSALLVSRSLGDARSRGATIAALLVVVASLALWTGSALASVL